MGKIVKLFLNFCVLIGQRNFHMSWSDNLFPPTNLILVKSKQKKIRCSCLNIN